MSMAAKFLNTGEFITFHLVDCMMVKLRDYMFDQLTVMSAIKKLLHSGLQLRLNGSRQHIV